MRVSDEHGLELGRGNLEPFVLDQLLEPVDNEDLVVVVHVPDVSGVQPALLVDGPFRCLRIIKIP